MTEAIRFTHIPASDHEKRTLNAEELFLSNRARNPPLATLNDGELSDLIWRLQMHRDRTRELADRQVRDTRFMAAPTVSDTTRYKHDYLSAALERAVAEFELRGGMIDGSPAEEDA